jgi:hypothetical protein
VLVAERQVAHTFVDHLCLHRQVVLAEGALACLACEEHAAGRGRRPVAHAASVLGAPPVLGRLQRLSAETV